MEEVFISHRSSELGDRMATLLFEELRARVEPFDPMTYLGVFALLLVTGLGASAVPALRATKVDPMVALSSE